jgi:hypothetical protein
MMVERFFSPGKMKMFMSHSTSSVAFARYRFGMVVTAEDHRYGK